MGNISVNFSKYLLHNELTDMLHAFATQYPHLIKLQTIGQSYENRDVWAATITNYASGDDKDKPAMYVDGNIHAGEVTSSMACLHLINYLLSNWKKDPKITQLMNNCAFYIIPRVNPDGAEKYLTTPTQLRSSVKPYPEYRETEDPPGLYPEDINDDGEILLMRVRDDQRGAWKADIEDARLMVPRSPLDANGPFYHIYTEGLLRDATGRPVVGKVSKPFDVIPTKYGLDLNRNFPAGYSPLTKGAGPYPLSEPETRNQVAFIHSHPNIAGVLLYHTTGGVFFRPHSTIPDDKLDKADLQLFTFLGKLGTEVTGYPVMGVHGEQWSGVLDDWCYEQLGLFAFTPELWDVVGRAAPELKLKLRNLKPEEQREMELKLLQWNDRELAGQGFVPWHKFHHPQLDNVEIGGWKIKECRQNPPLKFLEQECHKMTQFALNYALALPQVHIDEVSVEKVGSDVFSIVAIVSNHGYLSTNISKQAVRQKTVREDLLRIHLDLSMQLINGQHQTNLGFLEGYSAGQQNRFYHFSPPAKSMQRVEWTVKVAKKECLPLTLELISARGGRKKLNVTLQ